jgi:hypothetical protein
VQKEANGKNATRRGAPVPRPSEFAVSLAAHIQKFNGSVTPIASGRDLPVQPGQAAYPEQRLKIEHREKGKPSSSAVLSESAPQFYQRLDPMADLRASCLAHSRAMPRAAAPPPATASTDATAISAATSPSDHHCLAASQVTLARGRTTSQTALRDSGHPDCIAMSTESGAPSVAATILTTAGAAADPSVAL